MMNLPNRITTIMDLLNMNAAQVAEKGNISMDSIYSIRRGQSKNPGAEILKGLSKAFNLSIDYIVSEEEISLEVIEGKRSVSLSQQTPQVDIDMELYQDAILALDEVVKSKKVVIDKDLRKFYVNKIYQFAVERARREGTPPVIDNLIVEWLVDKKL